jgi:hypothetical protein
MDQPAIIKEKPPYRGTIIVDSNVLFVLQTPIAAQFRSETAKTTTSLLDILHFLSNHGYRIIIPEIVAYETGSMIRCGNKGKCVNDYFPKKEDQRNYILPSNLRDFFKNAISGKFANIDIAETSSPEEVLNFLEKIKEVLNHHPKPCPASTKALVAIQNTQKENFGDMAIEKIAEDLIREHNNPSTITIISDDRDFQRRNLYQLKGINILDTIGLLQAFLENGLGETIGIRNDLASKEVIDNVFDYSRNLFQSRFGKPINYIDCNTHDGNIYSHSHPSPFNTEMKRLADELGVDKHEEKNSQTERPMQGQINKFLAKYGTNWRDAMPVKNRQL